MTLERKGRRTRRRWTRRGLTVVASALVLAAIVVGTGIVGYLVLNAVGSTHSKTSSTIGCAPRTLPQCGSGTNATQAVAHGAGGSVGAVAA